MRTLPVPPPLAWPLALLLVTALLGGVAFLIAPPTATAQGDDPPILVDPDADPPLPPLPPGAPAVIGQQESPTPTPPPAPQPPVITGARATSFNSVTVTLETRNDVLAYSITWGRLNQPYYHQTIAGTETPHFSVSGLDCEHTYYFWARVFGDGKATASTWSAASLRADVTLPDCPHTPTPTHTPTPVPTPTPTPDPIPEITIVRQSPAQGVVEGNSARFTVRASPAPRQALSVNLDVDISDGFRPAQRTPTSIVFPKGRTETTLTLQTAGDKLDEKHGTAMVTVLQGNGYTIGDPDDASVSILDDDKPPTPKNLRVNGHLENGEITLRWDPIPGADDYSAGAISYKAQYREEFCTVLDCEPRGEWQEQAVVATSDGAVMEATLGGLTQKPLYEVAVQTVIVDASNWSNSAFVFPTDSPLGAGTKVATAPFHGFQAKNEQGSHEFRYVLCGETIPKGLTLMDADMMAATITDAVDEWENTVVWNRGRGNIISTTAYDLPEGESCSTSAPSKGQRRFEVKFVAGDRITEGCGANSEPAEIAFLYACWGSPSFAAEGIDPVDQITEGSVLLNADADLVGQWNRVSPIGGCTYLYEVLVHEIGHAFGIGNNSGHPRNSQHSIMSYEKAGHYCQPQAYDIVALMALYQSR